MVRPSQNGYLRLLGWLLTGAWKAQPVRWALSLATVALGVALGVAIHTVNRSALLEFSRAVDQVNGQASLQIVSRLGRSLGMDDQIFDALMAERQRLNLKGLSPVLEVPTDKVLVLGIDLFRAAGVSPALLPQASDAGATRSSGSQSSLFADDAVFLSPRAMTDLGLKLGDTLSLSHGSQVVDLRVAGELPGVIGQPIAVMDLGLAQWRFGYLGRISRIDLATPAGFTPDMLERRLEEAAYPVSVVQAAERTERLSQLSRAYRVNLTVLALVALLTGGFLVFTAISLSALQQQSQLALLRALGAPRGLPAVWVFSQAAAVAGLGGVLGIGLGLGLAQVLLGFFGGDLGGGYFGSQTPPMAVAPLWLLAFLALALALGLVAALPAYLRLQTDPITTQLRSGRAETLRPARWTGLAGLGLALAGLALSQMPAVWSLPLFSYAAIASLLFAGVLLVPWLIAGVFASLWTAAQRSNKAAAGTILAGWRLSQAPATANGVTAGVVAAVSLTVAMAVMVSSFRDSVSQWLDQVLPADVYVGTGATDMPIFTEADSQAIAQLAGVARVDRVRQLPVLWANDRPEVMVIARSIDWGQPQRSLPLVGPLSNLGQEATGRLRVFVSEAMVDLYSLRPGVHTALPFVDALSGQPAQAWVVGVFRDYGRQHGAVVMASEDFERLTGDQSKTGLSVWLKPGVSAEEVMDPMRALGGPIASAKLISAESLRALSLKIFDRSFALTYALELAALLIAVFAVASGFTAQVMLRRKEFALLAQLGQSFGQRMAMVLREALALLVFAVVWGSLLGLLMSQILIHRVNPQSFHWTMETSLPILPLSLLAAGVVAMGLMAALLATRRLLQSQLLAPALREDW
jgi:putative ABC transport system permease protein